MHFIAFSNFVELGDPADLRNVQSIANFRCDSVALFVIEWTLVMHNQEHGIVGGGQIARVNRIGYMFLDATVGQEFHHVVAVYGARILSRIFPIAALHDGDSDWLLRLDANLYRTGAGTVIDMRLL